MTQQGLFTAGQRPTMAETLDRIAEDDARFARHKVAFDRGHADRMTGHEADPPLNDDRQAYLNGYAAATRELGTPTAEERRALGLVEAAATLPAELVEVFGEPISVYTRQQAIEDGELVDVSEWAGPKGILGGGFRDVPVALTRRLWELVDVDAKKAAGRATPRERMEDTRGRAHDVLWMALVYGRAAAQKGDASRWRFPVKFANRLNHLVGVIDGDGVTLGFPEDF